MQKLDFLSEQAMNLFTRKYRVSKFYSMGLPQSPFLNEQNRREKFEKKIYKKRYNA